MNKPLVGIVMGSKSDLDIFAEAAKVLDDFGVKYEMHVLSAHRTPAEAVDFAQTAQKRGMKTIIAGAGGSAHLAGVLAAHTLLPVIAIPIKREGHDHESLFSNIMMPPGIPLATMPENGGKNTGLFAVEILALQDHDLAEKYAKYRKNLHDEVIETDKKIQELGWKKVLKGE
jgi:5-(carboxyamino)imidazole ribonucleotide mutase